MDALQITLLIQNLDAADELRVKICSLPTELIGH